MKIKLEFDEEERTEAEMALNGYKYHDQIDEIWNLCFRPNNKNGYNDELLDSDIAYEVIEKLAEIYLNIVLEE